MRKSLNNEKILKKSMKILICRKTPKDKIQVLYQMFLKFTLIGEANLTAGDYLAGVASFLVIAFGGILIGLIFAVIVSLATRFFTKHGKK
jgi:ABC-type long-subunit fatty acid transport system fused permease/ATPase subunit